MKYPMICKPLKMLPALVLLTATITSAADPQQANDYDVVDLGEYFTYYNRARKHSRIGYLTPHQFETNQVSRK
ncbi:MAG: IS3 family transposase [Fuerstiella sp.]